MGSQTDIIIRAPVTWGCYAVPGLCIPVFAVFDAAMPQRRSLALNYAITALFFSAVALGILIAGSQGARLVDRFGSRKLFLPAVRLSAAALMALGLSHHAADSRQASAEIGMVHP